MATRHDARAATVGRHRRVAVRPEPPGTPVGHADPDPWPGKDGGPEPPPGISSSPPEPKRRPESASVQPSARPRLPGPRASAVSGNPRTPLARQLDAGHDTSRTQQHGRALALHPADHVPADVAGRGTGSSRACRAAPNRSRVRGRGPRIGVGRRVVRARVRLHLGQLDGDAAVADQRTHQERREVDGGESEVVHGTSLPVTVGRANLDGVTTRPRAALVVGWLCRTPPDRLRLAPPPPRRRRRAPPGPTSPGQGRRPPW